MESEGRPEIVETLTNITDVGELNELRLSDGFWEIYNPLNQGICNSLERYGYSSVQAEAIRTFIYECYANARLAMVQQILEGGGLFN